MLNKKSITWRLVVLVLVGAGCILLALTGYSYFSAKTMLEDELMDKARYTAVMVTTRVEAMARPAEIMAAAAGGMAKTVPLTQEQKYSLLERLLADTPEAFGAALAVSEPNVTAQSVPYVCRAGDGWQHLNLGSDSYAYQRQDWYVRPHQLKRPVWSEPYYDEGGGNILMATYSVPLWFDDAHKQPAGVATADVSLASLGGMMRALNLGQDSYAFIVSSQGKFIAHPNEEYVMKESLFSMAEKKNNPLLKKLGDDMVGGKTGYIRYTSAHNGQSGWIMYVPITSAGWSLGIFFSQAALMNKVFSWTHSQWYLMVAGLLLLLAVAMSIGRSITRPIRELELATRSLAFGNLDVVIPYSDSDDEVDKLAETFSIMVSELKIYMEIIKTTAASQERIESELRIARTIQLSLLPDKGSEFCHRPEFSLGAMLESAREVGGDFYDFFFLDKEQENLFLIIGDVSDKGVAAALFMAVARTLVRSGAKDAQTPAQLLAWLNNELAKNNDSCMFVTVFCAAIHLPSGCCRYANGGHSPALLLQGQDISRLADAKGPLLGAMEDMLYREGTIMLQPNDVLFFYTDGVSEAADRQENLFGEQRLLDYLAELASHSTDDMLTEMRTRISEFADGAQQSDDITMLTLRYHGPRLAGPSGDDRAD